VVKVEVGLLPAAAVTRHAFCTRREAVGIETRTRRRRRRTGRGFEFAPNYPALS
jgi:hypothetical protein